MAGHLTEKDLSKRSRLSARTLQRWRWQKKGPTYLKLGGRVVYRVADVEAWEEASKAEGGKPGQQAGDGTQSSSTDKPVRNRPK